MLNLGLVINPLAGIGGAVALKGSDGTAVVNEALKRGAQQRANERTRLALDVLLPLREHLFFYTAGCDMGADLLRDMGFAHEVIYQPAVVTTAQDTETAINLISARQTGLLLFAGGDGTARNVCAVVAESTAVLGIPAGVKIHSSVYAVSPRAAGNIVLELAQGAALELSSGQVMDLDEEAYRTGTVKARLFGYMLVPSHPLVQQNKMSMRAAEPQIVADIAEFVVSEMQDDQLYVIGSGSTCAAIKDALGMSGSLLGVDVWYNGKTILSDATEMQLYDVVQQHKSVQLIVTLIGGQGHVFGRGNQQLSPRVLRTVGRQNIRVVASPGKLQTLQARPLIIDSGDPVLDREFSGPIRVITGYNAEALYRLEGY